MPMNSSPEASLASAAEPALRQKRPERSDKGHPLGFRVRRARTARWFWRLKRARLRLHLLRVCRLRHLSAHSGPRSANAKGSEASPPRPIHFEAHVPCWDRNSGCLHFAAKFRDKVMQQIGRIRIAGAMELQNVSRELRRLVNLDAVVCRKDGECFPILLTDISRDGCPFRTDAPSRRATLSP